MEQTQMIRVANACKSQCYKEGATLGTLLIEIENWEFKSKLHGQKSMIKAGYLLLGEGYRD